MISRIRSNWFLTGESWATRRTAAPSLLPVYAIQFPSRSRTIFSLALPLLTGCTAPGTSGGCRLFRAISHRVQTAHSGQTHACVQLAPSPHRRDELPCRSRPGTETPQVSDLCIRGRHDLRESPCCPSRTPQLTGEQNQRAAEAPAPHAYAR